MFAVQLAHCFKKQAHSLSIAKCPLLKKSLVKAICKLIFYNYCEETWLWCTVQIKYNHVIYTKTRI